MKLNLLPQTVSKGQALRTAWVLGAIIMLASAGAAIFLSISSRADLKLAQDSVADPATGAANAVATAANADTIVASAADVIRDANLAKAMIDHNDVYPKLYADLNPYIPSFFRINSESAAPVDATTSTVTLTGTLGSYQQYSDLVLSLMRFKDAKSISRSGYEYDPTIVPNLTPADPVGTPRKQTESPVSTDQIERLAYYSSQAKGTGGYTGQGGFGSGSDVTKGAMPGESLVTIVLTVNRDLQTPDPEATLTAAGSASAAATGAPGAPASFPGPGTGAGGSGLPTGAPPVGGGGGGRAGKGAGAGDSD